MPSIVSARRPPPRSRAVVVALALALTACQTQSPTPSPLVKFVDDYIPIITQFGVYRLDINHGNYLSQDMVDRLKVGQTKPQVRGVLGTPLVVSAFRDNRWDYVYEFRRAGRVREHRQFTVYFKDDLLARWEGDEMPPSVQELNRVAATRSLPEDPYGQDAGIVGKIIDFFKKIADPAAAATP